jgi:hypothetical protein
VVEISRSYALEKGNALGFYSVGRALQMTLRGPGRTEHPLELQAGHHVLEFFITVLPERPRIDGFEPQCKDEGSHFDLIALPLLRKIYRLSRAEFLAGSTFSLFKIDAVFRVNGILQGNSLGVSHISCLALAQTLVEFITHSARTFFGTKAAGNTPVHVHIAWDLIEGDVEMARRTPKGFNLC